MKNTKPQLSLLRSFEIAKEYKFSGPADLDEISLAEAKETLEIAGRKHHTSLTIKTALEVLSVEYAKQKTRDADSRPVMSIEDPPLPTSKHEVASWRDKRVWS